MTEGWYKLLIWNALKQISLFTVFKYVCFPIKKIQYTEFQIYYSENILYFMIYFLLNSLKNYVLILIGPILKKLSNFVKMSRHE